MKIVEIEFVSDIVGHDIETIKQMYEDWSNSPKRINVNTIVHVDYGKYIQNDNTMADDNEDNNES